MNAGVSTSDAGTAGTARAAGAAAGATDSAAAPAPIEPRPRTLGEVVDHLGPGSVTALGRLDRSTPLRGTEFYDAMDELQHDSGELLIVPSGSTLDASSLAALAALAADRGYAALALKCPEEFVETAAGIAEISGIAMLRVTERVGWRIFEAVVAGLLGEHRGAGAGEHPRRGPEPLFAIANELATQFGGSVAIEDLGRRIVAYSSVQGQLIDATRTQGILARRVPDSPLNHDQYRTVLRADGPVKLDATDDELPRIACAVRAGALPLGTIWVVDGDGGRELMAGERDRLESAAALAAAYMLDDIRVREAAQAPREERLRTLLSGAGVTGSELAELGIPEERGASLVSFDPGAGAHPTTLAQLRSTVQRHLALHRPEAVAVAWRGRVHAIIAAADDATIARMIEPLLPMLDRLASDALDSASGAAAAAKLAGPAGSAVGAGSGPAAASTPAAGGRASAVAVAAPGLTRRVAGVTELRERSEWLFDTAASLPGRGVAAGYADDGAITAARRMLTVESMRPQLMLSRVAQLYQGEPALTDPALAAMMAEQPALADAVLAWCEAFGNVTRAAQAAGVHENTIRYRLRRAEERYGVALGDPDTLLAAWLQLRAA